MGRGANPEQTRQKILSVAEKLFLEKGYDGTTIQDIVDGLGGMTKGVIYHHFKSKFQILETLLSASDNGDTFFEWHGETGLEKLQNSIRSEFQSFKKQSIGYSAAVTLRSPRILGEQYLDNFEIFVPEIEKIIKEGVADGSIETEFPRELAEWTMISLNLWLGNQLFILTEEEAKRKILFIKKTFEGLGVPVIDEDLQQDAFRLIEVLKKSS